MLLCLTTEVMLINEMLKRKANLIPYRFHDNNLEFYLSLRSKTAKQYPNYWSFWGGGIEGDEMPEQAMLREIQEELEFEPKDYKFFKRINDPVGNEKHLYYAKVENNFEDTIIIHESQGGKFFTKQDIENEKMMILEDKKALYELFDILIL